ncbi:MAG: helix-turn-helix domain-containing protein [Actinomycetaceae bacterium]|nr:helix-turn-helix domain-containing protein [Actinomycetaceae bacterium]
MTNSSRSSDLQCRVLQTDLPSVWSKHIASSFVPLEFSTTNRQTFSGRMQTVPAPRASATLIEASHHSVTRSPDLIAQGEKSRYKIGLQLTGRATLTQDGRQAHLRPGDLVIYDTSRPYSLEYPDEMASLVLMVSPQSLGIGEEQVKDLTAVRFPADSTLAQLVSPLLQQIAAKPQLFGAATQGRLAANAVDLLATVFRTALDLKAVVEADEAQLLRSRVVRFIELNIRNPQLNAKMIADAHFMSVRSLYALFEGSKQTVAQLIRTYRLEGAMRDLTDPAKTSVPIATIAAAWVFLDAANFSRAFKAHFGLTPGRARALAAG